MPHRFRALWVPLAMVLLLVVALTSAARAQTAPSTLQQQMVAMAEQLQARLNNKRYLLDAISQVVRNNPQLTPAQFDQAAQELFAGNGDLTAIQLARDLVISHTYPLSGNEATIGHHLLDDPNRREQTQRALESNRATLAGPYHLRQGGIGFIMRQPIYLDAAQTQLWGLAVVVMSWDKMAEQIGLKAMESQFQFAIRSLAKDQNAVVLGDRNLFDEPQAFKRTLKLANTQWQISLKPREQVSASTLETWAISLLLLFGLLLTAVAMVRRQATSWHTPAALASALICISVAGIIAYHQMEQRNTLLQSARVADHVRRLIYQRIQDNQNYLYLLSQEYRQNQLSTDEFIERGGRFVTDHPELLNINWVSADLVIQEVPPHKGNDQILGLAISLDAPLEAAVTARDTRSPAHTRLFKNIQGKYSFETWYPIYRGNEFQGLFAAVYDVSRLVKAVVPASLASNYAISVGFPSQGSELHLERGVGRELVVPGHGTRLHVAASEARLQRETLLMIIACFIVGCGLFAGIRVLQRSNQRLAERFDDLSLAQEALYREKEYSQITLNSIADGVITLDREGRVQSLNRTAERFLVLTTPESKGQPLAQILTRGNDSQGAQPLADSLTQMMTETLGGGDPGLLHGSLSRGNKVYYLQCSASRIEVSGRTEGVVVVMHDVTQLTELASELEYQVCHDSLTGLINRAEFERRCTRALTQGTHYLLYLDLDQFKLVNDTCGHLAGDKLLIQLSGILQSKMPDNGTLARLGGDEFGVLLTHCSEAQAMTMAETIRVTVKEFRFVSHDKVFELGCSIGVVPTGASNGDYDATLARADLACYIAKDSGRNRIHLFTDTDHTTSQREGEMSWASQLKSALENDRFLLYQQPMIALSSPSNGKTNFEVLLRLKNEQQQTVPPGAFMPAAERFHLATALDRHVIELILSFLEQRPKVLEGVGICSINLSGQSISDPAFTEFLCERLNRSAVKPQQLCFEITETAAVANLTKASEFIQSLRAKGVSFALDDFGSGMSSFGYLKALPVNYLKIDGNFVRDIGTDAQDRAFVEAIHNIGHSMGMATVAECVEDPQTLALLEAIGVNYAQGFGIATPKPLNQLKLRDATLEQGLT
ncbi:EAL domain-containing protein [Ferrimonas kyonanensis]|uniref:EAL domain-containing protein n=1 Tax=Ferrimonas kyonanensis TaxID=364763 RepID=UPI00040C3EE8|nr:EAL domain-containing protein [Ferrimonas kyonanensis]